jgi:hypothetical protein
MMTGKWGISPSLLGNRPTITLRNGENTTKRIGTLQNRSQYYQKVMRIRPYNQDERRLPEMKVAIGLDAKVTRGAESWQFFAFVFAAVLTLVFSLLEESYRFHARVVWERMGIKTLVFAFCFYIFMRNDYVRNNLAKFLGWLKVEK